MRRLLVVLGAIALVIVIAGAVNHAVNVRVDYLLGTSSDVSLFWFAVAVAVLVVAAGLLGILAGRASQAAARRKLETELDTTYRRLREAQAAVPARVPEVATPEQPPVAATVVAAERVAAPTVIAAADVADPPAQTVIEAEAAEPATTLAAEPGEAVTSFSPPRHEAETGVVPPVVEPQTAVGPDSIPPAASPGEWGAATPTPPPAESGQPDADTGSDPDTGCDPVQPPLPPA